MIFIGNKKLVFSQSLLIEKNEKTSLEIKDFNFKINIFFEDEHEESQIKFKKVQDHELDIIFKKWNSKFGIALQEPAVIARAEDGEELKFLALNVRVGNINKLEIQFFTEAKK